jgi:hypothetical protein
MSENIITQGQADQLDQSMPAAGLAEPGARLKNAENYGLVVFKYVIDEDASGGLTMDALPFDVEVTDVTVVATTSNASGTLTLADGDGNDITDGIACATDTNTDRADVIDDANYQMAAGEQPQITANGSGDRGIMYVYCRRR